MRSAAYNSVIQLGNWIKIGEFYNTYRSYTYAEFTMSIGVGYSNDIIFYVRFGKDGAGNIVPERLNANLIASSSKSTYSLGFKVLDDPNRCALYIKAKTTFSYCTACILGITSESTKNNNIQWDFDFNLGIVTVQDEDMTKIVNLTPMYAPISTDSQAKYCTIGTTNTWTGNFHYGMNDAAVNFTAYTNSGSGAYCSLRGFVYKDSQKGTLTLITPDGTIELDSDRFIPN